MSSRRVLLVRHCESTGQEPEAPLTSSGQRQAVELAGSLGAEPIDLVVTSPFRRARETIEPLARERGLLPRVDSRLSERRLAEPPVDDWRDHIRSSFNDPDRRAPGGESGREALVRGWAAVRDAFDSPARLPVLVTHGHLLALILHSIEPSFGYEEWEALGNPDLFSLSGSALDRLAFERIATSGASRPGG